MIDEGRNQPNRAWLRALQKTAPIAGSPERIFPSILDELAQSSGAAPALLSDASSMTYQALAEESNRFSRWALDQGIAKGEAVALLMPNCPEYLAIWAGITRVGGVVALLNTNLTGAALARSIGTAGARHIIAAPDLADRLSGLSPLFTGPVRAWVYRDDTGDYSAAPLTAGERRPVTIKDPALYIYTSGTTGPSKAAIVSHHRLMEWSHWFAGMMDTQPADRMYNCLPMYHSVGGVVATGAVLVSGGSVVLREKFSAREFWNDIVRWDCTLFQYIGELCRYLLRSEPDGHLAHRIRLCCGNGLKGDIWDEFRTRFRIPQILEFYAATEGSFSLYNIEGKSGAVGRIPPFLAHRFPIALVQYDPENQEPLRNADGHCVPCGPEETGEALGRVATAAAPAGGRFEGYTDAAASDKKVLRNVFEPRDAWFRTGDLMRKDKKGYFYFVDRVGDTFRWKGENVATSEVADAICAFRGVQEAIVYGVAIPGQDGRACMASLVPDGSRQALDFAALRLHLAERLPSYAHPLFLRIRNELDSTSTFKYTKTGLLRDGFDPGRVTDAIYFNDSDSGAFVRMDRILYERIRSGKIVV